MPNTKKNGIRWSRRPQKKIKTCVAENEHVRAGDVIATVEHGIRVSREFDHHLTLKKLTQQYWATRFAEYIVERNYPHAEIIIEEGE